jgi:subtilisin family serine protease
VAVLDTGIDKMRPWLQGRCDGSCEEEAPARLAEHRSPIFGHGTFIAGIIGKKAPSARLIGRRLGFNASGVPAHDVADRLWVLAGENPGVINVSWGAYTQQNLGTLTIEEAIERLQQRVPGCVVVCAAGNDGRADPTFPGAIAMDNVVAIGAIDSEKHLAEVERPGAPEPFDHWASNYGDWVDRYALGVDIRSCYPPPPPDLLGYDDVPGSAFAAGFADWDGTSFSAAAVSGALAAEAGRRPDTPAAVLDDVLATFTRVPKPRPPAQRSTSTLVALPSA